MHSLAFPFPADFQATARFWQQFAGELQAGGRILILLLPVLTFFFFRAGTYRVTSIADVFLVAFVIGFGFDLTGAWLASSASNHPLAHIGKFPPWQIIGKEGAVQYAVAGYGYWNALVALVIATSFRFVRSRRVTIGVIVTTALFVITEEASAVSKAGLSDPAIGLLGRFSHLTLNGRATAWIALLALVACSIWETVWVNRSTGNRDGSGFSGFLSSLFKGYGRLPAPARWAYQARLIQAERAQTPDDPKLADALARLNREMSQEAASAPLFPSDWRRYYPHLATWAGLLILEVWFASSPTPKIAELFWSLPLLQSPIGPIPTLFCGYLIVTLAWRYLSSPSNPNHSGKVDDKAALHGEVAILRTVLTVLVIVLVYGTVETMFRSTASLVSLYGGGDAIPDFGASAGVERLHKELATTLLLFALAATTLVVTGRSAQWRAAASESQKRTAMVRNGILLAGALIMAWINVQLYAPLAHGLYRLFGKTFFEIGLLLGVPRGLVQVVVTLFVMLLMTLGLGFLYRKAQVPAERFLVKLLLPASLLAVFVILASAPVAMAQKDARGATPFAATAKAQLLQYRQERRAAESRRTADYNTEELAPRSPMRRAFAGSGLDPETLTAWAGWFYVEVGDSRTRSAYLRNLEDSIGFALEKADAGTVDQQDLRVIGMMMADWRKREAQALVLYDSIAVGCRNYWASKQPGYYFNHEMVRELSDLWLPANEPWRAATQDPLDLLPDPLPPLLIAGAGLLALGKPKSKKKSAADFARDIWNARSKFEDLQHQLQRQNNHVLDQLKDFNNEYNKNFNDASKALLNYATTYQKLMPDMEKILDLASDQKVARQIAKQFDEAIAAIQVMDGVGFGQVFNAAMAVESVAAAAAGQVAAAARAGSDIRSPELGVPEKPSEPPATVEKEPASVTNEFTPENADDFEGNVRPKRSPKEEYDDVVNAITKIDADSARAAAIERANAREAATGSRTPPPGENVVTKQESDAIVRYNDSKLGYNDPSKRLNLLQPDDYDLKAGISAVEPRKGWFDVVVHGDPNGGGGFELANGEKISAKDFAQKIQESGWDGKQPIRLLSCSSGNPVLSGRAAPDSRLTISRSRIPGPTRWRTLRPPSSKHPSATGRTSIRRISRRWSPRDSLRTLGSQSPQSPTRSLVCGRGGDCTKSPIYRISSSPSMLTN